MAKYQAQPTVRIESLILTVRGLRVLLDSDLAKIYGVSTKALNQALKRNSGRFPDDFCFKITAEELDCLRSQIVTSRTCRN
ncbi:MAG TPA: ORF6N domain-containing protein [Verrucomicrobiae bacterium]